jgi:heme/copper-type cytochrome/quinol oxidase subunit 2
MPAESESAMDTVLGGLNTAGETAGFEDQNLIDLMPATINVILGMMGILVFGFFIYAGILYLTSQGNKEMVEKAKKIMQYTVLGMLVIIAAYAIVSYVLLAVITIL